MRLFANPNQDCVWSKKCFIAEFHSDLLTMGSLARYHKLGLILSVSILIFNLYFSIFSFWSFIFDVSCFILIFLVINGIFRPFRSVARTYFLFFVALVFLDCFVRLPVDTVSLFTFCFVLFCVVFLLLVYDSGTGGREIPPPWFKAKFWRYFKLSANSSSPNFIIRKTRDVSETSQ